MGLKKRNKVSAEFSMSSLTDIIFLLLIFFMLTSSLVTPSALDLKLPSSSSEAVASQSTTISITKDGKYYLNNSPVPASSLRGAISKAKQDSGQGNKFSISIAADKGVAIEYVVNVMDIANRLRIGAILATEKAN